MMMAYTFIPDMQEQKIGGLWSRPARQKVRPYYLTGSLEQTEEYLPNKQETLSSNPYSR
jgi:hypothetical protein